MNNEKNKLALSEVDGIVPQLRFPEFKEGGEWEITTIGELGSFYYGKSAPKWSLSEDAPTLCVRYGELYTKFGAVIDKIYSRTNIDPKTLRFSKGGEILVPRVGEDPFAFSNCSYLPFENIAIGEMISVYETDENSIFYTYYFNTLSKQFARVVEGQNVKNLYYVNLEPIKVGKPKSKKEQQKIANCLSSLDALIHLETKKLNLLQDHKKGLLQQLFPQEGKRLPKYRFPEFKEDGVWEETTLMDICDITNGKSNAQDHIENGEYPLFDRSEVIKASDKFLFACEAVILPGEGMRFIPKYYLGKFDLHQRAYALKGFNCVGKYVYYYMLANSTLLASKAVQSTVLSLRLPILQKFPIIMPIGDKGILEQQKIANTLTAVDALIDAQTQKIETLQTHKKGLLQQLFPNVNEL